jgi:Electron transfer DM13
MTELTARRFPGALSPLMARLLSVPALLVVLSGGAFVFAALVTNNFAVSSVLVLGWFGVVGAASLVAARRWPGLRSTLVATFAAACVVALVGGYWTSVRDDVVNETVAVGVPAREVPPTSPAAPAPVNVTEAEGAFSSLAHDTSGTARIVRLAGGGRVLTLTDLATDNGPDLRVYLVAGGSGDDVSDNVDLGELKGNIGNQQYSVPEGVDTTKYRSVVVWCRAFSVAFGRADLTAA